MIRSRDALEVVEACSCRNQLDVISKQKHISLKQIWKVIHVYQEKDRAEPKSLWILVFAFQVCRMNQKQNLLV